MLQRLLALLLIPFLALAQPAAAKPFGAPLTEAQMAGYYAMSYANAPQAVLTHIPDSYHFIMSDQPERFRTELLAFLTAK